MRVQDIRRDFPILKEVIYLDSASTSLTPEPVLEAVLDYYRDYKANVGRGVYRSGSARRPALQRRSPQGGSLSWAERKA